MSNVSKPINRWETKSIYVFCLILLSTGMNYAQQNNSKDTEMSRQEVYTDIEQTLGLVPSFFKLVPDRSLELEWKLFKTIQLGDSPIPHKYRELIGVAVASVTKCHYCSFFHTEVAKLFGATNDEIEDAVHYAKSSAGWSTYINGLQIDYEQFTKELMESIEYLKKKNSQSSK